MKITPHVSPFLAWGDFHARSRFARSTMEKWGTTRSLALYRIAFLGATKRYLVCECEQQRPGAAQNVQTIVQAHRTRRRRGWPRGFGALNSSSPLNIYFRLNGFRVSLLLIYFRDVHTSPKYNTKAVRYVTPNFRVGAVQLHCVTEITDITDPEKSPLV